MSRQTRSSHFHVLASRDILAIARRLSGASRRPVDRDRLVEEIARDVAEIYQRVPKRHAWNVASQSVTTARRAGILDEVYRPKETRRD